MVDLKEDNIILTNHLDIALSFIYVFKIIMIMFVITF